jgi:hypothetical protein
VFGCVLVSGDDGGVVDGQHDVRGVDEDKGMEVLSSSVEMRIWMK